MIDCLYKQGIVIKFDSKNSNCIILKKKDKLLTAIACPPITNGCDIINFGGDLSKGYTHDFDELVLVTTEKKRKLYYKGRLIDKIKR